jgi:hypothetical protein
MSVIQADVQSTAGNEAGEFPTLLQKIARALDRLAINRSRRTIPAMALRRARYQHDRCRRLMHQRSIP